MVRKSVGKTAGKFISDRNAKFLLAKLKPCTGTQYIGIRKIEVIKKDESSTG
jgi:hypothetical protein